MEIIATPPPPSGIRRSLFRLPILLYRLRLGWLLRGRFMLITHLGRVSGKPRQTVIEAIDHDPADGSYIGPSGYGRRSDWYRNILKTPEITIQVGSRRIPVTAVPLTADEGSEVMARYCARHPRLGRRLSRFLGFLVDGSDADFREVGRHITFVRFVPR